MRNNFFRYTDWSGIPANKVTERKKNVTHTHTDTETFYVNTFYAMYVGFRRTKQNALYQCRTRGKQIIPVIPPSVFRNTILCYTTYNMFVGKGRHFFIFIFFYFQAC